MFKHLSVSHIIVITYSVKNKLLTLEIKLFKHTNSLQEHGIHRKNRPSY